MHKILQKHLFCAFVADSKIYAKYALYPESFCDKNLAIRKVFAFCDSVWLSLALTATLWHTPALSGSLLLSNFAYTAPDQLTGPLLGSHRRCHDDALFPALLIMSANLPPYIFFNSLKKYSF